MTDVDKLLARAQVSLALLTLIAFVGLIFALLFHQTAQISGHHDVIIGLLSGLGTVLTLQMNYFFARHRSQSDAGPDPTFTKPPQAATTQPKVTP